MEESELNWSSGSVNALHGELVVDTGQAVSYCTLAALCDKDPDQQTVTTSFTSAGSLRISTIAHTCNDSYVLQNTSAWVP
jgi:hypothetical protein